MFLIIEVGAAKPLCIIGEAGFRGVVRGGGVHISTYIEMEGAPKSGLRKRRKQREASI